MFGTFLVFFIAVIGPVCNSTTLCFPVSDTHCLSTQGESWQSSTAGRLGVSTSYNPTSADQNYDFKSWFSGYWFWESVAIICSIVSVLGCVSSEGWIFSWSAKWNLCWLEWPLCCRHMLCTPNHTPQSPPTQVRSNVSLNLVLLNRSYKLWKCFGIFLLKTVHVHYTFWYILMLKNRSEH